MASDVINGTFKFLESGNLLGKELIICWHSGEPLVLPIRYYVEAVRLIESLIPAETKLRFKFQTNGTLVTPAWCEFFKEIGAEVGVSIDGFKELHDGARKTRSGEGTFDRTLVGIRHLQSWGIPLNVICVLSLDSLAYPQELFQFFEEAGIERVCFNIEETEGVHRSPLMQSSTSTDDFRRFFTEYVRLAQQPGRNQWVRELDSSFRAIFLGGGAETKNQQVTPFEIVTINMDGSLSTFSPELIGATSQAHGNFVFGNVLTDSFFDVSNNLAFKRALADISRGVEECRRVCTYFDICGGGAPSNKFFEAGSLSCSETRYCRAVIQSTADVVLEHFANA